MANNDGFFVHLGLKTDKNSFEDAYKAFDQMNNRASRLIGTIRNAAVVAATFKLAGVANEAVRTADKMGVSTEALENWRSAAKIAGADSKSLITNMSQLANVMNRLTIDGKGLEQYSEQLGLLKLSIRDLEGMTPDMAYAKIIGTAQNQVNNGVRTAQEMMSILEPLLGTGGVDLFQKLQSHGQSIYDFLAAASGTVYMDGGTFQKGEALADSVNLLKTQLENIGKFFGTEVLGEFTPYLGEISNWLTENKDEIKNGITTIADIVGKIFNVLMPIAAFIGKTAGGDLVQILEGLGEIANGNTKEGLKSLFLSNSFEEQKAALQNETGAGEAAASIIVGARNIPGYKHLVHATDFLLNKVGLESDEEYKRNWGSVKDGIIRPDGTITQVAPDDWVFAARNVSDLARAFIPQGMAAGAEGINTYSIVQNFTINGTRDTAQTIRQQAFNGTRDGLMATMNQSSNRLQQMSGTR